MNIKRCTGNPAADNAAVMALGPGIGDTLMLFDGSDLIAFAVCHSVPLVEGRIREELRVLKLVARSEEDFEVLVTALSDHARRSGTRRVALRDRHAAADSHRIEKTRRRLAP